jgi:hypothetical protein
VPDFTHLERAILDAICDSQGEGADSLRSLLSDARPLERDNTGHGFYTTLEVGRDRPALAAKPGLLDGPIAHMLDMGAGMMMGFILWFDSGYPNCLEGYQYCDNSGDTVDLRERDLASLSFSRLEWGLGSQVH